MLGLYKSCATDASWPYAFYNVFVLIESTCSKIKVGRVMVIQLQSVVYADDSYMLLTGAVTVLCTEANKPRLLLFSVKYH